MRIDVEREPAADAGTLLLRDAIFVAALDLDLRPLDAMPVTVV
jgi:hypothetical protein